MSAVILQFPKQRKRGRKVRRGPLAEVVTLTRCIRVALPDSDRAGAFLARFGAADSDGYEYPRTEYAAALAEVLASNNADDLKTDWDTHLVTLMVLWCRRRIANAPARQ